MGWPTSVTKDGVNFVLAQEQTLLLADPIFHSIDAANAKRERQTYNWSVCNRKRIVSPISTIAILQFRFQLGVWIAMVFAMQRDQFCEFLDEQAFVPGGLDEEPHETMLLPVLPEMPTHAQSPREVADVFGRTYSLLVPSVPCAQKFCSCQALLVRGPVLA